MAVYFLSAIFVRITYTFNQKYFELMNYLRNQRAIQYSLGSIGAI